jgi:hypothetical protein
MADDDLTIAYMAGFEKGRTSGSEEATAANSLVSAVRSEICNLLSGHIDTPNLGRDALRRLRDFIDAAAAGHATNTRRLDNCP